MIEDKTRLLNFKPFSSPLCFNEISPIHDYAWTEEQPCLFTMPVTEKKSPTLANRTSLRRDPS
jgi:hypothetical protein